MTIIMIIIIIIYNIGENTISAYYVRYEVHKRILPTTFTRCISPSVIGRRNRVTDKLDGDWLSGQSVAGRVTAGNSVVVNNSNSEVLCSKEFRQAKGSTLDNGLSSDILTKKVTAAFWAWHHLLRYGWKNQ